MNGTGEVSVAQAVYRAVLLAAALLLFGLLFRQLATDPAEAPPLRPAS